MFSSALPAKVSLLYNTERTFCTQIFLFTRSEVENDNCVSDFKTIDSALKQLLELDLSEASKTNTLMCSFLYFLMIA